MTRLYMSAFVARRLLGEMTALVVAGDDGTNGVVWRTAVRRAFQNKQDRTMLIAKITEFAEDAHPMKYLGSDTPLTVDEYVADLDRRRDLAVLRACRTIVARDEAAWS